LAVYKSPDGVTIQVFNDFDHEGKEGKVHEEKQHNGSKYDTQAKVESKQEEKQPAGEGICHVDLPCEDKDRITKFFTDTFGWSFFGEEGYSFFKSNDPKYPLKGGLKVTTKRITNPCVYFAVKDIDATLKKVEANGGKVVAPAHPVVADKPEYGIKATIADTEGNEWFLYSHKQ